jgi:cyclophilin family peptidyl-prolyl cis-trans isomerase
VFLKRMFSKSIFNCFVSVSLSFFLTSTTYSEDLRTDVDWNKVVQDQNAEDVQLVLSLESGRSDEQAQALRAFMKIITMASLKTLINANEKISSENFDSYCLAMGQMYHVNIGATGEPAQPELIQQALTILEGAISADRSVSFCFEAFAKISPRASDSKLESLFRRIEFSRLSDADRARVVMALYFHRQNTYDQENPDDRYWFSADFKKYFRSFRFEEDPSVEVRQSYARVAYLSKDELIFSEYSKLILDSDFTVRFLAVDLINFVEKKNSAPLYSVLDDSDHRIVIRAIEKLTTLGLTQNLYAKYKKLLTHPRRQVRRAMLTAVLSQLSMDEITKFLTDESLAVRQIAAREFILRAENPTAFAESALRGSDIALKKGVIDASESLADQRIPILEMALDDFDLFVNDYVFSHIIENQIESLYPQILELLGANTFEERFAAVQVLMLSQSLPERQQLIVSVFKSSQQMMFAYLRELIIEQLIGSESENDHQLLLTLLPLESNWRIANQIGRGLKKFNLADYVDQAPVWPDAEGAHYKILEKRPQIEMETTKGTMVFELYNDIAPLHVSEILWEIDQGLWSQNFFHRVIDNFVAQAYRPASSTTTQSAEVRAEIEGLKQERGTIAMPRSENLHSGEGGGFYINLVTNFNLNYDYTVFGKIVSGDGVLSEIEIGDRVLNVKRIK